MKRSKEEGLEMFVLDPKNTYLRNRPNNCTPKNLHKAAGDVKG